MSDLDKKLDSLSRTPGLIANLIRDIRYDQTWKAKLRTYAMLGENKEHEHNEGGQPIQVTQEPKCEEGNDPSLFKS